MNKTKVLVFTNLDKWDNMAQEVKDRINATEEWENNYPKENNPSMSKVDLTDGQARLYAIDDLMAQPITDEEGIFLVYDKLSQNTFDLLKQQCSSDTLYILAHRNGDYPKQKFGDWKYECIKEDSHIPDASNCYHMFFDILTDSEGKKMNRIIKQVFRPLLDAALGLLHQCLADSNFDPSTYPLAKSFPKNSSPEKALITYNSDKNLEALRNELLKYALEQN